MNLWKSATARIAFALLLGLLAAASQPLAAQDDFFTVTPCRLFDSRTDSTHQPPDNPLKQGVTYTLTAAGVCGVPADANAVALNVTVIGPTGPGDLVVFPAGTTPLPAPPPTPPSSVGAISFGPGQTKAMIQIVALGTGGQSGKLSFRATIDPPPPTPNYKLVLDVTGYFLADKPPVLTAGGTLNYTENDPPTAIDTTITVSDPDDPNLASATVQITSNYQNGADVLSFTNTATITGIFAPATGTLTLTGSDTLANWQTALRSVRYNNTSDGPSTLPRTVTWIGNDGSASSAPVTSTIDVTAVNDAPAGADKTITFDEGNDYVFATADFGFSDPFDTPPNALLAVKITTLPALGSLKLSGGAVSAGQFISAIDIAAGNLKFTPAGFGTPYTSFTFQVQDDGGTALGGVDLDGSANTITFNVSHVNQAPTDIALSNSTVDENQPVGTAVGTFSTTDPDAGDTFTYTLVSGAGSTDNGSFQISGNQLQTNAVFDFEVKSSYSIRVRSTDNGGLFFEKVFTITVNDKNDGPTDIALSNSTVDENQPVGTLVGTFSTTDQDAGDTFTYTLVSGAGSTDNGSFQIVGNQLKTNAVFDFEVKSSYSIRVRSTDSGGAFFEKAFTITVNDKNDTPTDIALSNSTVDENQPVGTLVGTFSTTDQDPGDTHTYALVAGAGSTDNGSFQISGNQLQTNAVFDFEVKSSYSIRVRSTDSGGAFFEKVFTITINNKNDTPTDIALSNSSVDENKTVGTLVGTFSTTDQDVGDTFTYTLVSGTGSTDNGSFVISGNQLQTNAVFDFETKSSYSIRVRSTDSGGAFFEKVFTIAINNKNETPTDIALSNSSVNENQPTGTLVGTFSTVDPDIGDTFTYTLVAGAGSTDNGSFQISGNQLQTNAMFNFEVKSSYSIRVRSTDSGGLFVEKPFTITIIDVPEAPKTSNDTFDTIGNTEVRVDRPTDANPNVEFATAGSPNLGVLDNDTDDDAGQTNTLTVDAITSPACGDSTAPFVCATTNGGTVTMESDGSFSYVPPAGNNADDTFTYRARDTTSLTSAGQVTLKMHQRVWYVRNNSPAGGGGTSTAPFDTLAEAGTAAAANEYIFVHFGDGTTTGQNAGIALKAGQHLLGEFAGLTVTFNPGILFNGVAGTTSVPLFAQPGPTACSGGPCRPFLDDIQADAIEGVSASNAIPIEIVGLNLAGNVNALDLTNAVALPANAALTIKDNVLRGSGAGGIDVNLNAGTTGTLALNITNNSWDTAGTHTGNAVDINRAAGTLQLNFSNNANIVSSATAVNIAGGLAASAIITGFANNSVHQNTVGSGVLVNNVKFDANPATVAYEQVSGGTTAIGISGNGVGGAGMVMSGVSGDLGFTDLDIFADGGAGLQVTGTGLVNTGAGTGTQITVGAGVGIIEATGGAAVDLTSMTTTLPLASLKSTNSGTTGVNLQVVGGSLSAGNTSSITNATNTDFNVFQSNATVTYDGTITDSTGNATNHLVLVDSCVSGTKTFTGAISDTGSGTGGGVWMTNNPGVTVNYTGQLTLATGGTDGFVATGGGTVSSSNTNSTVVTTTGTAVKVTSTQIGSAGVKFKSVSAGTAASGPTNGIIMTSTGTTGTLTVSGSGSAGTGGTIQKTGAEGILITGPANASFSWMSIQNPGTHGISSTTANNLTVANTTITDAAGSAASDDGIRTSNTTGTLTLTSCTINGARHQGVTVDNLNTNMSGLSMTGTTVTNTPGGDGMLVQMRGTSVLTSGTISGNTFSSNSATGLQVNNADTGNIQSLTVQNNTVTGNNAGMDFDLSQSASMTINVLTNTFNNQHSTVMNFFSASSATGGTMTAKVQGNIVGTSGTLDSGSAIGSGIRVFIQRATQGSLTIDGNQIREVPNASGIDVEAIGHTAGNSVKVKITNNTISRPTGTNTNIGCGSLAPCPLSTIFVLSDTDSAAESVCSVITGNTAYDPTSWPQGAGQAAFYLARRAGQVLNLEGNTSQNARTNILNNNTVTNFSSGDFIDESGNVTVVAAGTCGAFP